MASNASFTRHDGPTGTIFDIKPARTTYSGYGWAIVMYVLALFLREMGAGTIFWMPIIIAGACYHYFVWQRYRREPVMLTVSAEGVRAGSDFFPSSEIHSLYLCQPWRNGGFELVEDNPVAVARDERSYALMLRRTSSSKLLPIARGLTYRTGVMLRDDVTAALRR